VARSKTVTREQAELKKAQAADFMERMGDSDRADEFDSMSVDEYAEGKGLRLSNPPLKSKRRIATMARSSGPSKADLQDQLDQIGDILDDAYDPQSSREDLAAAVGEALDVLNDEETEDESDDPDSDDDDRD
jgi:ribonuclease E